MAYTEAGAEAAARYKKKSQKAIIISFKKDVYNNEILPAIEKSGMPVATFFKEAAREKIERDGLV